MYKEKIKKANKVEVKGVKPSTPTSPELYPFSDLIKFEQEEGQALGPLRIRKISKRHYGPHVPLTIYWKNGSVRVVNALVDTGVEVSLIHGNPSKFKQGISLTITTLEGKEI